MYFKVSMRTNPQTGIYSGYYRLVESYRNENGRVCHRTMLNAGYLDELNTDQLNLIQKLVSEKAVTTTAQNIHDQTITIRRCSEPNEKVKQLYDVLKYKYAPFTRKKSVVHRMENKKP
jgi:hypothetical protein